MPITQYIRPALLALSMAASMTGAHAATLTTLHSFTASPDGREPRGGLTPFQRKLYGTTNVGGSVDSGTIYRIDPTTGSETILYSFQGASGSVADGNGPEGEMVELTGVLYGTTAFGGEFNAGTIFSFDPTTRIEQVLYSFGSGTDGAMPAAGLVERGGSLYGTTSQGGSAGLGTVFAFSPASGQEAVLHHFIGGADGAAPFAPVALDPASSLLYGTTFFGGPSNDGTVFSVDARTGDEVIVHAFTGPSFSGNPSAGVTLNGRMLYGTTAHGGLNKCGGGCGSIFQIDLDSGAESDVYRFTSRRDGEDPEGGLVYNQGTLYGSTLSGGAAGLGTLFSVDVASGMKTTLHVFNGAGDGMNPGTLLGWRGALFGTAATGGAAGQGSVFRLSQ